MRTPTRWRIRRRALSLILILILAVAQGPASGIDAEEGERAVARRQMSQRVDELLALSWSAGGVAPAPLADDAEFLRRVSLDLTGVVPSVSEARAFLSDPRADRRSQLIARLLRSPRHATHLAITWRTRMLPEGFNLQEIGRTLGLQNWLRRQFLRNLRYDNLVADLIASQDSGEDGPALYFTSLELKPEKLAASTARIFLGLQIQCAECHKHPFDSWRQEDFWGYAAFFAQLDRDSLAPGRGARLIDANTGEVTLPDQERPVPPAYPGGGAAGDRGGGTRRQQLAIWIASKDNPFLSKAAVNWAWAHLFGRGIVDPVDDLSDRNPPSHPELLQELADYFERTDFDLRNLLRTLAETRAYQLTSRGAGPPPSPELFARMSVKTLSADQFYDSLLACLQQDSAPIERAPGAARMFEPRRLAFVTRLQSPSRSSLEFDQGPPQALLLMNGPLASEATDLQKSALLASLEAPFFTDEQRLDVLFLATLTRRPRDEERQSLLRLIRESSQSAASSAKAKPGKTASPPFEGGGADVGGAADRDAAAGGGAADRGASVGVADVVENDGNEQTRLGKRQIWSDILWAVLNSAEFALNH